MGDKSIPISVLQETFSGVHCPCCAAGLDDVLKELLGYAEAAAKDQEADAPAALASLRRHKPIVFSEPKIYIAWKDDYAIGHDTIDQQHHQLVDLINKLYATVRAPNRKPNFLADYLKELYEFAQLHFETEMAAFEPLGPACAEEQAREHQRLLDSLDYFCHQLENSFLTPAPIFAFITTWFFDHTQKLDRKCVNLLKTLK